jgi:hypothetical protein
MDQHKEDIDSDTEIYWEKKQFPLRIIYSNLSWIRFQDKTC